MIRYHTVITWEKGRCAFHQPEAIAAIRNEKYNTALERTGTVFFFPQKRTDICANDTRSVVSAVSQCTQKGESWKYLFSYIIEKLPVEENTLKIATALTRLPAPCQCEYSVSKAMRTGENWSLIATTVLPHLSCWPWHCGLSWASLLDLAACAGGGAEFFSASAVLDTKHNSYCMPICPPCSWRDKGSSGAWRTPCVSAVLWHTFFQNNIQLSTVLGRRTQKPLEIKWGWQQKGLGKKGRSRKGVHLLMVSSGFAKKVG